LAFALAYPEPRVLDAIDDLLGYALIRETASSAFEFSHDIVREVASGILNPGRRVALHREFARRFESSTGPEAKLQLARHYRAAGMPAPAANAFLESAQRALTQYAFRDALERANDGAHVLDRIERDVHSEALLSRLHLSRAQASAHMGDMMLAVEAANEAVRHARISAQNAEIVNALLVRSSFQGALVDAALQLTDALEASALGAELEDARLRARAAVQAASATRTGGALDQALQLAREACATARQCGDASVLYAAYEEMLQTQIMWWRFEDARSAFAQAAPVAERAGISAQARFFCLQCASAYLMEQPDQAAAAVKAALQGVDTLRERGDTAPPDPAKPVPLVSLTAHYLQGTLAAVRGSWNEELDAIERCKPSETIACLPRYANALLLLEIDARLGRNEGADAQLASRLVDALPASLPQSMFGWSDSAELARARVAARLHRENVRSALRTALDAIEEQAQRMPLDCDRAFDRLAHAAAEAGEMAIRQRALARSAYYRARRMAGAAAASAIAPAFSR
jgi:hypothetical protein